jgi:hypothetical protein
MHRRQALLIVGLIAANSTKAMGNQLPKGSLTIDLSQWAEIVVRHPDGKLVIPIDPRDVYQALLG